MGSQSNKRRYRNPLEFVESGFLACWRNTQDLVAASKKLIDSGLHAPALSLAVLALEELAKLMAIDGLLYARPDDHKAATFSKASRSHLVKLAILELLPLMIDNLSRVDPRYGDEQRYHAALAISLMQLKDNGNAVLAYLEGSGFIDLDNWKQRGSCVSAGDRGFTAPHDAVEPPFAKMVYDLAWRATTTLDFVLKGGNLERYIRRARRVRDALTEEQHQELERLGKEQFQSIFCDRDDENQSQPR